MSARKKPTMDYESCRWFNNNTNLEWCEKRHLQCPREPSCTLCYELDELPEILWGAVVDCTGLIIQEPIKCIHNLFGDLWWSDKLKVGVQIGLIISSTKTKFGSFDKKDVENFILGVRAIQRALKNNLPLN